jgi:cysteine-S-conjugate beta-lyase
MDNSFDHPINRYHTASIKWDGVEAFFGEKDVLPMWVADMDFMSPKPVLDAIRQRADHGILGYTKQPDSYFDAVIRWMESRHGWRIRKEWIYFSPGVVPSLNFIVQAFTNPEDKVMIQPPVYYPFKDAIINNGRTVIHNPLCFENDRYGMDFDDLRRKLDNEAVKLLILCNPHNPVGRVWTREELAELGNICADHKVIVVSDDIHADIVFEGHSYTPLAAISENLAANTIVCTAASKTFNIAGLQTSNLIIPNPALGDIYGAYMNKLHLLRPNLFGMLATESAYMHGDEWLAQVLDYLQKNLDFMTDYIGANIKGIKVLRPEGTYLVWLDCRALGLNPPQLDELMLKKAKVALDGGTMFAPGGEGFTRMNIACPRSTLEEGLRRIRDAVNTMAAGRR